MPQYIEKLNLIVKTDTDQIVLLNRAMLLANMKRMKDKSSQILRQMSQIAERLKIINNEIAVLQKDSNLLFTGSN